MLIHEHPQDGWWHLWSARACLIWGWKLQFDGTAPCLSTPATRQTYQPWKLTQHAIKRTFLGFGSSVDTCQDGAGVSLACLSSSWISQKLSFLSVVLRLSIVVRCLVVNTFFLILPTPYYIDIGWKGVPQGVKLYTESKPLKKNLKKVFEKFGSKRKK